MARLKIPLMLTAALLPLAGVAESGQGSVEQVYAELAKHLPGLKAEQVRASPVAGLYEVEFSDSVAYATADGRYLVSGDLYEVATRTNLTDARANGERRVALAKLDASRMIVFAPEKPAHIITVFTDVDCPYCRKLHGEIAELNKLGIAVRYLAYPRSGPNTESWAKMAAVWCAADRRQAITRAKNGESLARQAGCATQAIAEDYALGRKLGLKGTPMIVLEDGSVVSGYIPPAKLAQHLQSIDSRQKTAAE